jgi:hypothetical protein
MKSIVNLIAILLFLYGTFMSNISAQTLLNEIEVDPAGTDNPCEYIELKGTPGSEITNVHFVSFEGDSESNRGVATAVVTFGSPGPVFGSNGLLILTGTQSCGSRTYPAGTTVTPIALLDTVNGVLQNGTNSFLLISSVTPITPGTDYDADNNGTLEGLPGGATIIDAVAWSDGGADDITYGGVVLNATGGTIGACTRFPGNTFANSASAWYAGAMTGTNDSNTYNATIRSTNFPIAGALTPGAPNAGSKYANVDMNGDGHSDFVQVRGTGSQFTGNSEITRFMGARGKVGYYANHPKLVSSPTVIQEYWYVYDSLTGPSSTTAWGDASVDWNVPADYDGDGKVDIAVWRPGSVGSSRFFILRSSDGGVDAPFFGQDGDDPTVVADYDGDGIADIATFSCPSSLGPCSFNYVGSHNNPLRTVTSVSWGTGTPGSIDPIAGDYDGDGKADFCVYREDLAKPGQGQYALHKSDGSPDEFVDWGLFHSDIVVPGDFDGDGKTDFMVVRDENGNYVHWLLTRTNQVSLYFWGITGDIPTPGDYDGDGKTDVAVWRPAHSNNDLFFIINSHDGSGQGLPWGQCLVAPCDEPVADWQVH